MDIPKYITDTSITIFHNGYCEFAPNGLNPHSTMQKYDETLQYEIQNRKAATDMLKKILDNTEKTAPDFAKQVLEALENRAFIVCTTNAELAASAISDILRTPYKMQDTLQNQATCFRGVMFSDSKHSDLMMRTMQSVLRDIIPHFNAVDMIMIPSAYQSIIDNTSPDEFRYKNPQYPTTLIRNTAFELNPQSVKERVYGALEQIKGAVSEEARQAINDTEAQLDSIIVSALQDISTSMPGFYAAMKDEQDNDTPGDLD